MVRALAGYVRPGGVIVFHELTAPAHRRIRQRLSLTATASGGSSCCDRRRRSPHGHQAPCVVPGRRSGGATMRLRPSSAVERPRSTYLRFAAADLIRSVVTELGRLGIATVAEVDIDTLHERMLAEVIANESVIVGRSGNRRLGAGMRRHIPGRSCATGRALGRHGADRASPRSLLNDAAAPGGYPRGLARWSTVAAPSAGRSWMLRGIAVTTSPPGMSWAPCQGARLAVVSAARARGSASWPRTYGERRTMQQTSRVLSTEYLCQSRRPDLWRKNCGSSPGDRRVENISRRRRRRLGEQQLLVCIGGVCKGGLPCPCHSVPTAALLTE